MAALFLACKLEEVYKKIRVIALVFYRVFQRRDGVKDPAALSVGSPVCMFISRASFHAQDTLTKIPLPANRSS